MRFILANFLKRLETQERHQNMSCKVFEIKINKSKLNQDQNNFLSLLFLEAKWFYNDMLSFSKDDHSKIYDYTTKKKNVFVKINDNFELRELTILSSQMKQQMFERIKSNIKALSTKKKNGEKVGKLKFKSFINSVPLIQLNSTYKIDFENKTIKLPKYKKPFKVFGLEQLKDVDEICNAHLIRKSSGIYFKITTFSEKEKIDSKEMIGLDFGIKDSITFSNGIKIKTNIQISKQIRKQHKKLSRKKKGSNNRKKEQKKLRKLYERQTNKKRDVKNKIVSYLKKNFGLIVVQNENIKAWHSGLFGKQIQESSIGGILSGIKNIPQTIVLDRFFPSTQLCPACGVLNKHGLSERMYRCDCGYERDRDVHSAQNMLREGLRVMDKQEKANDNIVPVECREINFVESKTSVSNMINCFWMVDHLEVSFVQ